MIANTPVPPYYAVIFSSLRTETDNGYAEAAQTMMELAAQQAGFLGVESARNQVGITVSYWADQESIKNWRDHAEHTVIREKGRKLWYKHFKTRICKVERDYEFFKE